MEVLGVPGLSTQIINLIITYPGIQYDLYLGCPGSEHQRAVGDIRSPHLAHLNLTHSGQIVVIGLLFFNY